MRERERAETRNSLRPSWGQVPGVSEVTAEPAYIQTDQYDNEGVLHMLERLYSRQKAPASRARRLYRKSRAADLRRYEMIRARVCLCLSVHEYCVHKMRTLPYHTLFVQAQARVCVCVCVCVRGACVRACVRACVPVCKYNVCANFMVCTKTPLTELEGYFSACKIDTRQAPCCQTP